MLNITMEFNDSSDIKLKPEMLELYHQAFPSSQRKDDQTFQEIIENHGYSIIVIHDQNRSIGFSATKMIDEDIALLEYMAVNEEYRNLGVGGRLFERGKRLVGEVGRTLILEVDKGGVTPEEAALNARRKRFYARHGCKLARAFDYILPLGGQEGTPMDLMIWNAPDDLSIKKQLILSWVSRIYADVYNLNEQDSRLAKMKRDIDEVIYLGGD